jgi:hypothetical protein
MYITFEGLIAACIISFVMGAIVTFHTLEIAFRTDAKTRLGSSKWFKRTSSRLFSSQLIVAPVHSRICASEDKRQHGMRGCAR